MHGYVKIFYRVLGEKPWAKFTACMVASTVTRKLAESLRLYFFEQKDLALNTNYLLIAAFVAEFVSQS